MTIAEWEYCQISAKTDCPMVAMVCLFFPVIRDHDKSTDTLAPNQKFQLIQAYITQA